MNKRLEKKSRQNKKQFLNIDKQNRMPLQMNFLDGRTPNKILPKRQDSKKKNSTKSQGNPTNWNQ